ncbi:MAG: PAS domain-containing protein [bacterium]
MNDNHSDLPPAGATQNPPDNPDTNTPSHATLLEAVGVPIVATDLRGRITYWNRAAAELFGWQGNAVQGRNFLRITHAETSAELTDLVQDDGQVPTKRVLRHRDHLGLPINMLETDLYDAAGKLSGYVSVSTIIGQRSALTQDLFPPGAASAARPLLPLSGVIIPVCARCQKVRDTEDQWLPVDEFLKESLDADISHSLCPPCASEVHPELFSDEK